MRSQGLHGSNYIVLHVRVSEEKTRERGKQMPPLDVYPKAAASALLKANVTRVFLQTATPSAVAMLEAWSQREHAHLSYTDSERTVHDLWMRRDNNRSSCIGNTSTKLKHCRTQAGERSSVVAQAVNALIASRARVFVSPPASMWTSFISGLLRRRASDAVTSSPSEVDKRLVEIHRVPSVRNHALRSGKGSGQPEIVDTAGWTDF